MRNLKSKRGQGLVEYIILVMLMGIALIAVVRGVSSDTKDQFEKASNKIQQLGNN